MDDGIAGEKERPRRLGRTLTLREVAATAGVSLSTASRAIRNHPDVSEATRTRVEQVGKELGYYPSRLGRGLATGKSMTIGLMVADITNPFYPQLARGIEDAVTGAGYTIILCNTEDDPVRSTRHLERLLSHRVDGVIHASVGRDEASLRLATNAGIPLVIANRRPRTVEDVDIVVANNTAGARAATQYLLSKGRKKIAHLAGPEYASLSHERLEGYRQALAEAGIEPDDRLIPRGLFTYQSGYARTQHILSSAESVDAIFAVNDLVALGALDAIAQRGLHIPDDVALVGFDDTDFAAYHAIQLASVSQNIYEMGQTASRLLLDALSDPENHEHMEIVLETELVVRRSCG